MLDLDDFSDQHLVDELARRKRLRDNGMCDYCKRFGDDAPCKYPKRHALASGLKAAQIRAWVNKYRFEPGYIKE